MCVLRIKPFNKYLDQSLRHTSTISGPSYSLLRAADMTVWQLEHALASGLGQSGQLTLGKHVLAVSTDRRLKYLRGGLLLINTFQVKHLVLLNVRSRMLIV